MKVRVMYFIYYPQNVPGKEKSLNKFSLCPSYHLQIVLLTRSKETYNMNKLNKIHVYLMQMKFKSRQTQASKRAPEFTNLSGSFCLSSSLVHDFYA